MKVTMKNEEFIQIFQGLVAVKALKGVKFGILVAKNIKVIQTELQFIEEAGKPSPEFIKLSQEMEPLVKTDQVAQIKALEERHADLVDARKAQLAEVEQLMDSENSLDLFEIPESVLPEEISAEQIMNLEKLIKWQH